MVEQEGSAENEKEASVSNEDDEKARTAYLLPSSLYCKAIVNMPILQSPDQALQMPN